MKLMTRAWVLAAAMAVAAPSVWAAAALQVMQADGKTLVRATAGKLAAWRSAADTLIVVVPAESGTVEIGGLPGGVTAEKVTENGLNGVVVKGVTGSWQVVQDGANWVIRPGAGLKAESVLMLRDGWRVGNETLKPQSFTAEGKQWQVGMVDTARSVAGSVAGVVRAGAAVPMTAKVAEPAKVVEVAKVEPVVAVPAMKPAQAMPLVPVSGPTVRVEATEGLKPLGQPAMAAAALPVKGTQMAGRAPMDAVSLSAMLSRIEPAAGPSHSEAPRAMPVSGLVAPQGLARAVVASATATLPVATTATTTSGLTKVVVRAAPAMRPIGLSGVSSELLPQMLGDIYMPGTLISLTLPPALGGQQGAHEAPKIEDHIVEGHGDEHAAGHETSATVSADVSDTAAAEAAAKKAGGSWNQETLAPIEAALVAEEASRTAAPVVVAPPVVKEAEIDDRAPLQAANRVMPLRDGSYFDEVTNALQAIAEAPENSQRAREAQMNLAGVYLAWERPEEALAVIDGQPKRSDKLPVSAQARLYMALAQLARGDTPNAALLDLGGPLASHAKLWKAVAASTAGDYATALKMWPTERGVLPQYPAYLRELVQKAQATALVMVGDRAVALKVVDELVNGYTVSDTVPVGLVRLQGLVRLGTPDEGKGLEYLAAAAENMRDPAEAYRAKFEFVRALQQRHDLSDDQVRTYLTDLWFDWRGDDLERDVLNTLADLYDKAGESRTALQYWQTLVRAYPNAQGLSRITEKMTDAFLKVFDPENPKVYDTLSYVGLYYDFSELVPNDARGDLVQEQVARLLMDSNLWSRAVPILEQQLQYRPLDPAAQGRLALMLAEANGNLGNAGDGIKVLDKWQHVATTSVLIRDWKLEEAKLMLKLSRPANATKALAVLPKDDGDARDLRIEAAWAAQDWSGSVPLLQDKLARVPASGLVSDTGAQLATFRLSYALGQLRQGPELDALSKRYETGLARLPQLSDDLGAVAASSGVSASVVASGPLAPLTTALNSLNRMTENVEATRNAVAQQRAQQQEYNDKMRYMELLPPPAL